MIIHSLKISGFRIIGEPIEIHFPEEGRIGILGQNESGKTTLLQAIEYALYGLRKGTGTEGERENLVTWGKNEAKLEIEFSSGQDTYVLQRIFGAESGHKANLTLVINGAKDRKNSVTNLREIETKVEQITGMDRDSVTKLIYIRQKDLDALRDLAKSRREQLVNKVMGIEVFDDAVDEVKANISELGRDFEKKKIQLDSVHKNKEQYEAKQVQKKSLEDSIADLQQTLQEKKNLLDEAKTLLERFEWLYASNSTNEVISSLNGQLNEVKKDVKKIASLEKEIEKYETALVKYKPQVEGLENQRKTFVDLERRLKESEDTLKSVEIKKQVAITKMKLTSNDLKQLSQDLPTKKHRQLIRFSLGFIMGIVLLSIGLVTNLVVLVFSVVPFTLSAYLFYDYLKIDKLLTASSEVTSLTKQLEEQKTKVSGFRYEIEKMTIDTSFESCEDIDNKLSTILDEMKTATEQDSILGIEAVVKNVQNSLNALKDSEPSKKEEKLKGQIQDKETEISSLQKTKPTSIDELQYDKRQHEVAKKRVLEFQEEYNKSDRESQNKLGTIQQLKHDLEVFKLDYELYPKLEQEVQASKSKIELLEHTLSELSETSKELRNKVIPYARFIINQILPTITDGRYSDFEITEDLKFKVHSNEAGGYKEREIFSGGTQDQFLIALRLAFTQSILDSRVMADKYSLLMDECISSSDDARKQGIFDVLDAMKKTFSQIFVIAHEDISDFVDNHIVLARNAHGYTEIKSMSW